MSMKDKAALGLAVHWIQQALITAYEDNCSFRLPKKGRKSLKWTSELQSVLREGRQLVNIYRANNKPYSWELYREAQRKYRKEVLKASKETWRTICSPVNYLPRLGRLHRALSKDHKVRLGSLVAPTGERTQFKEESLDLLLATHFPNSDVGEGGTVPAAARRAMGVDWWVSATIITQHRVEWALDSFVTYKNPDAEWIFPALLKEGREVLLPQLVRICRACLATGYVPVSWHQLRCCL